MLWTALGLLGLVVLVVGVVGLCGPWWGCVAAGLALFGVALDGRAPQAPEGDG